MYESHRLTRNIESPAYFLLLVLADTSTFKKLRPANYRAQIAGHRNEAA